MDSSQESWRAWKIFKVVLRPDHEAELSRSIVQVCVMGTSVSAQLGRTYLSAMFQCQWGHLWRAFALLCCVGRLWYWPLFYARPVRCCHYLKTGYIVLSDPFLKNSCYWEFVHWHFKNQVHARGFPLSGSFPHMFSWTGMKPTTAHLVSARECAHHWFTCGLNESLNMCNIDILRLLWKLCQNFGDQHRSVFLVYFMLP